MTGDPTKTRDHDIKQRAYSQGRKQAAEEKAASWARGMLGDHMSEEGLF